MQEINHVPRYDDNFMKKVKTVQNNNELLPDGVKTFLYSKLCKFEYALDKFEDVTKYLFTEEEDFILETSVSMYAFFDLCKNDAMQKERQINDKLKDLESTEVLNGGKVTSQRSKARLTDEYKRWQNYLNRVQHIKHDCETMANTMDKLFNKTRTKLKERRLELEPGTGLHRETF